MTEKKSKKTTSNFVYKAIWLVCGILTMVGFFFTVFCSEIWMFSQLIRCYGIATSRGMLLEWVVYFVVITSLIGASSYAEIVLAMLFFGKADEGARSIKRLVEGKSPALSR